MSKIKETKKVEKKVVKKVATPKPQKLAKVKEVKSKVELLSFTISAVIPVMSYGNIQPSITVKAPTIEEAQAYALPVIENLFNKYVEGSLKPSFVSKAVVTEVERIVPQGLAKPTAPSVTPKTPEVVASTPSTETGGMVKSPALTKAENAVIAAHSLQALDLIENQVRESTKLTEDEKPVVYTLILKKRKEF